jgi:hypothetical protein
LPGELPMVGTQPGWSSAVMAIFTVHLYKAARLMPAYFSATKRSEIKVPAPAREPLVIQQVTMDSGC